MIRHLDDNDIHLILRCLNTIMWLFELSTYEVYGGNGLGFQDLGSSCREMSVLLGEGYRKIVQDYLSITEGWMPSGGAHEGHLQDLIMTRFDEKSKIEHTLWLEAKNSLISPNNCKKFRKRLARLYSLRFDEPSPKPKIYWFGARTHSDNIDEEFKEIFGDAHQGKTVGDRALEFHEEILKCLKHLKDKAEPNKKKTIESLIKKIGSFSDTDFLDCIRSTKINKVTAMELTNLMAAHYKANASGQNIEEYVIFLKANPVLLAISEILLQPSSKDIVKALKALVDAINEREEA